MRIDMPRTPMYSCIGNTESPQGRKICMELTLCLLEEFVIPGIVTIAINITIFCVHNRA